MFENHRDRNPSSFNSPSARHLQGRDTKASRTLPPGSQTIKNFEAIQIADSPVSQELSVQSTPDREFSGRSMDMAGELRAQEWLDDRLAAFYREGHGVWPRIRRFLSGGAGTRQ